MDSKIVGRVIKAWRLRADMSQKELAQKAGLSESTVGAIERGERRLSDENFVKICLGMSMTVDEIFDSASHLHLDVLHEIERRLRGDRGSHEPAGGGAAMGTPTLEQIGELYDSWMARGREILFSSLQFVRSTGPEARLRTSPPLSPDPDSGKPRRARVGRSRQRAQRK